jgi:nicotinate dehydrogenase subunit B
MSPESIVTPQPEVEIERYELRESPRYRFAFDRRGFIQSLGGGIAILLVARSAAPAGAAAQAAQESGRLFQSHTIPQVIDAWLHIAPSGAVTVFTGKVEVGQNIRTSLSQAVADELRVPMSAVTMVMGDTQRVPFDMGTFGSRTTPQMGSELRRASAAARLVLMNLAAKRWGCGCDVLHAANGAVHDPAHHRSLTYGELAHGQLLTEAIPAHEPTTPANQWTIAGVSVPKVNGGDFVTGRHRYTPDLKLPGMLYGKVVRPSAFGAKLVAADVSAAQAMPGVKVVRDGDFLGVAAPDLLTAERAAAAVKATWNADPQISNAELFTFLTAHGRPGREQGGIHASEGDVAAALAASAHRIEATYNIAYIQHCPLEPRAALAVWRDGRLTVWTGTQRPFGVQEQLAQTFRLRDSDVRVIMPDTGSAYGGKHTGECAVEAARLARGAGRPVHLLWTRAEEFTWAYFRPAGVIIIKAGVNPDGSLAAWEMHNYNSGPAALTTMYTVPHKLEEFHPVPDAPLRQGSYRSLAACANHFARESHMDDLARAVNLDPLAFRLKNCQHPRLRAVYLAAAQKFNWQGRRKRPRHGFGLAGGIEKGGHLATCAEVRVEPSGEVRILRVVEAFDCGAVVDPNGLQNTISGAITMGIGGALYEAIEFANGKILNPTFARYRVPRFRDEPQIDVVLVNRKDEPSFGAGETPIVGLAPAVGNAIVDAIGLRRRDLPMAPGGKLPLQA